MTTVEELFAEHKPEVAALAAEVRDVVLLAMRTVEERVYPGWHGLGFHHPRAGYIVGLFPRAGDVRLGFERGIDLPDPEGVLTGDGSQVRHLDLTPGDIVPLAAIVDLIDAAVALGSGR